MSPFHPGGLRSSGADPESNFGAAICVFASETACAAQTQLDGADGAAASAAGGEHHRRGDVTALRRPGGGGGVVLQLGPALLRHRHHHYW